MAYINGKEVLFSAVVNENTGITPTGEIEITTNGPHNVKEFETALVNVPVNESTNEGLPILLNSEEEMNSVLANATVEDIGKIYKYNGDLYVIEGDTE